MRRWSLISARFIVELVGVYKTAQRVRVAFELSLDIAFHLSMSMSMSISISMMMAHDRVGVISTVDFRSVVRKCRYKRKFGWTVDDGTSTPTHSLARYRIDSRYLGHQDVVIGNKKLSLGEQARVPARSPWDGTILTDQPLTETMMDYVFASLGFPHTSTSIEHPLMFTEQICNPNFCRGRTS